MTNNNEHLMYETESVSEQVEQEIETPGVLTVAKIVEHILGHVATVACGTFVLEAVVNRTALIPPIGNQLMYFAAAIMKMHYAGQKRLKPLELYELLSCIYNIHPDPVVTTLLQHTYRRIIMGLQAKTCNNLYDTLVAEMERKIVLGELMTAYEIRIDTASRRTESRNRAAAVYYEKKRNEATPPATPTPSESPAVAPKPKKPRAKKTIGALPAPFGPLTAPPQDTCSQLPTMATINAGEFHLTAEQRRHYPYHQGYPTGYQQAH